MKEFKEKCKYHKPDGLPFLNLSLQNMEDEKWIMIEDNDYCMVSNVGRVKSLEHIVHCSGFSYSYDRIMPEKILRQYPKMNKKSGCPNLVVGIKLTNGEWTLKSVANLVLRTFRKKDGICNVTHHLNLNSYDNRLSNLAYESRSVKYRIEYKEEIRDRNCGMGHFDKMIAARKKIVPMSELNRFSKQKQKNNKKDIYYEKAVNDPITIYIKDKNFIGSFTSFRNASRQLGMDAGYLARIYHNPQCNVAIQIKKGIFSLKDFKPKDYQLLGGKHAIKRNKQIIKLYKSGMTQVDIAKKYNLCGSRINQIVNKNV